jgi:hypothetical protein
MFNVKVPPPGRLQDIFQIDGAYEVKAVWLDDKNLRVECLGCDQRMVKTRVGEWDDVTISYSF